VSENEAYGDFNGDRDDNPSTVLMIRYFYNIAFLRGMVFAQKCARATVFKLSEIGNAAGEASNPNVQLQYMNIYILYIYGGMLEYSDGNNR
jgi:hypothetical protein